MSNRDLTTKPRRRKVVFTLDALQAREVFFAGNFNDWNPEKHPLKKNAAGVWEKIAMLFPGRYEYKFLVDGQWRRDPDNPQECLNCFGSHNSVINVSPK
ncbi:MAG TPA: glycoside hydrolase [Deltaproteobacteria bacterium]|nr:glycoside hydrolase [Deltaproteobacteria bacterium]